MALCRNEQRFFRSLPRSSLDQEVLICNDQRILRPIQWP